MAAHNSKVLPSYEKIAKYAKENCYPKHVTVTETKASVSLQDLLNHTSARLVSLQKDVISCEALKTVQKIQLISKCGFDGSSSHSKYNQIWEDTPRDDSSVLLTSVVPLVLYARDESNGSDTVVWMNSRASSTLWCRPLEIEYTKETIPKIKVVTKALEDAIQKLESTEV
ncbi:hypothetical protein FOCC_FOCC017838 [Frankliniella occidentalis]|nr:hypothetical protein FOCC_FOCC017838 [Frankliniella occidentalis]